jgi:hypothetical protein
MEQSLEFLSLRDSRIMVGQWLRDNQETPDTRIHINILNATFKYGKGARKDNVTLKMGDTMDVCVSLTIPQIAAIVKEFFQVFLEDKRAIFGQMLRRILQKRWAIMTDSTYKDPKQSAEGYKYMQYTNLP